MRAPTLVRRELKNARLSFIPYGEIVDSVTVDSDTWPDADPVANWTAYAFADVETVKSENTQKSEVFEVPDSAGGYVEDEEISITKRMWKFVTSKTNSYLKMLEHGLASVPAASTAIAPGTNKNPYIDGVMLLEIQNKNGVMIERTQCAARLRLVSAGDAGPTTSKIEYSLQMLNSTANSFIVYAG
jgi:hypothetical protein